MIITKGLENLSHIDSIHLFSSVSFNDKSFIFDLVETLQFKKKELIYTNENNSNSIYFVCQGRVKVGSKSAHSKENIKLMLYEGDMFGEIGLYQESTDNAMQTDFAQAMEHNTIIYRISYDNMRSIIRKYPELNDLLIKQIVKRLKKTEKKLESLVFKDAKLRLLYFIKDLAKEHGKAIGDEILIKHGMTHQEIANITALSRQKVTTLLNELKNENKIYLERKSILVRDINKLK